MITGLALAAGLLRTFVLACRGGSMSSFIFP
jgi:hypothetical protein